MHLSGAMFLLFLYVAFISMHRCTTLENKDAKPNIIILLADDMGWNDASFHGSPQIPTPNIDYLARSGIILNNYYVCPNCAPSRGALLTGLYPIHTGLQHEGLHPNEPWGLSLNITLLPQHLRKLGYETHILGKWDLGFFHKEYTPTFRGFDSHYGYWAGPEDYFDHTCKLEDMWGLDFRHNMEAVTDSIGNYSTQLFGDHAARIIENHCSSKPLFLYVAYQAVHGGNLYNFLQAPIEYIERFSFIKDEKRKIYAAMVSAMDDSIKTIVDALISKNMLENSIILFSTDNGGASEGFGGNAASNWPLRGIKSTLWEGGVRGISFIWSSLLEKTGRTSMDLIHITDWLPTFHYAAGGNISDLTDLDGYNVWDTLSYNKPSPRTEVLLNIDAINEVSALRVGDYKVIQGTVYDGQWDGWYGPSGRENSALEIDYINLFSKTPQLDSEILCGNKPVSAIPCFPGKSPCLFDVIKDPCEFNNLADIKPEILNNLLQRLSFYNQSAVPSGNKPPDPRSNPKFYNYQWTNWMDYVT